MKQYTTTEAFKEMIQLRGIHNDLGISGGAARTWRKLVNDNPDDPTKWKISEELMSSMLQTFGYQIIQIKLWKK